MVIRTEKIIIKNNDIINKWLDEATAIYNQSLYYLRKEFFESQKENVKADYNSKKLYDLCKISESWLNSTLDYNVKQQVLKNVSTNWFSFFKACKAYWKDKSKFKGKPKILSYLENGRKTFLLIDKTRFRKVNLEKNTIYLPKSNIAISIPKYIKINQIKCLTIHKFYGKTRINIIYEKEIKNEIQLNKNNFIGIDLGVSNIIAITTNNQNKSWIVKGGMIKSMNQFYNKNLSKRKSLLETVNKEKTSKYIEKLNLKRYNKFEYEFGCLSKFIIKLCLDNNIGNIIIGHNKGWKQDVNLGKRNNQKFVQIPFNKLIDKIVYKAEEYGINVKIVEESYTSKIDHLSLESLGKQENYLGRRIKRGLFKSNCGKILNADINGAIGILRKENVFSDIDLINLRNRGDVVSPLILKYKS